MIRVLSRFQLLLILFPLLMPLFIAAGCSRYARYRVLSFVFDGVPYPDQINTAERPAETGQADKRKQIIKLSQDTNQKFRHPASVNNDDCSLCHNTLNNMEIPPKDMCLKCHVDIHSSRLFIHGPAALDCVVCHNVHESKTKMLLIKDDNSLCFECHYSDNKSNMFKTEGHSRLKNEELTCLECHDPHGGNDRFFLKKDKNA
jgi:predicted CXXCH cytochrome family protein